MPTKPSASRENRLTIILSALCDWDGSTDVEKSLASLAAMRSPNQITFRNTSCRWRMSPFPTPEELAREAREALSRRTETPREHFARLVRIGWINRLGEVTRLLGGDVEPEPDSEPGQAALAKKKKRRQRT
jgi:hypothetical protein